MTKLRWGTSVGYSYYSPEEEEIGISEEAIKKGKAPAVLAHELAHKFSGTSVEEYNKNCAVLFLEELATWEAAIKRGLPLEEIDEDLIEDSMDERLATVELNFGKDSKEYRKVKRAYWAFKKNYL